MYGTNLPLKRYVHACHMRVTHMSHKVEYKKVNVT